MIDIALYSYMEELLKQTPMSFKRYMYDIIPWDIRLTGIVGPRGIGKSTMMQQYIIEHRDAEESLYVIADNIYFAHHTLVE